MAGDKEETQQRQVAKRTTLRHGHEYGKRQRNRQSGGKGEGGMKREGAQRAPTEKSERKRS